MAEVNSSRIESTNASGDGRDLSLRWTTRIPLARRILAVNVFVIALMAGGVFYLDSLRSRLVETQLEQSARETEMIADALTATDASRRDALMVRMAQLTDSRLRIYDSDGRPVADSFRLADPTYRLVDPATEPFRKSIARAMDSAIDTLTGNVIPARVEERPNAGADSWPEIERSRRSARLASEYRLAPDRTPFISAASSALGDGNTLLVTANARDITRRVRAERLTIGLMFAGTLLVSILLSLFLARTIVEPLRRLMRAAVRVRWGRERDVTVPRLPGRDDEIGMLARAISDMTQSLRERIDAGEDFAADVAHELKNPISSLRSSIEALETVEDPSLRGELIAVARDDCRRLDRLVTDIAEASRMDAELSRARFERIDIGAMLEAMVTARESVRAADRPHLAYARPRRGATDVMGDDGRIERVFNNLLDNAVSFSPPGGVVCISATRSGSDVIIRIEDDGPGVPPAERDHIFRRFYSLRPPQEEFGTHSGLGLAIARAIVNGHRGSVAVSDREDGEGGACFEVRLPAASAQAPNR